MNDSEILVVDSHVASGRTLILQISKIATIA